MSNLNLARKLRPKSFDEIIGQDLSISMLKNSLYLKKLFPVYLFSGQRGCGKTSTARVFGAAINCENLENFQANAKAFSVPCLQCSSCKAMLNSNHPDFIEMDAASHTGVDSVRQIIESSSYMPLSGRKKIYLIDETHMLSKAAFNAFLKILEEPPSSTIFILATTEIQKIPDTVHSRCFQVVFNPVQKSPLLDHLKTICKNEEIEAEEEALKVIIQENDGSVRDTINTLEQVRFAGKKITTELVLKSLGKISETALCQVLEAAIDQDPKKLISKFREIQIESLSAKNLWEMLTQTIRSILWIKYGSKEALENKNAIETLEKLAKSTSLDRIHTIMNTLWSQEPIFIQTSQKHLFIETLLLSMCKSVCKSECKKAKLPKTTQKPEPVQEKATNSPWIPFIQEAEQKFSDRMLLSILKQAKPRIAKDNRSTIELVMPTKSAFLEEKLVEMEPEWKPILKKFFPQVERLALVQANKTEIVRPKPANSKPVNSGAGLPATGNPVRIANPDKWPKATLLTNHFSGKLEKDKS